MTTIKLKNGSGAPTAGDLVQGEPALDLTNKRLYTENASGTVIEVGTNPTSVTTGDITATGTATFAGLTTTADVSFGDNDKAIFGAGSDLQIYHDGTNSFITETGTGYLGIGTNGSKVIINKSPFENMAEFITDGAVNLYHNNSQKFATTPTGIDVTGTVTADGLTVESGQAVISRTNNTDHLLVKNTQAGSNAIPQYADVTFQGYNGGKKARIRGVDRSSNVLKGGLEVQTLNTSQVLTDRIFVDGDGDISFFDSSGSSQDLYWDASASSLGLGTTSPNSTLEVLGTSAGGEVEGLRLTNSSTTTNTSSSIIFNLSTASADSAKIAAIRTNSPTSSDTELAFSQLRNGTLTERMRIDSSGDVLIGGTAKTSAVSLDRGAYLQSQTNGDVVGYTLYVNDGVNDRRSNFFLDDANAVYGFDTSFSSGGSADFVIRRVGSEQLRLDSSGNLLVGKTSNAVSTDGIQLIPNGASAFTRTGATPLYLNRSSSDGTVLDIRKDNTTVGSIGVGGGSLTVNSSGSTLVFTATDVAVQLSSTEFRPFTADDATINLGGSAQRFKDLYLSGDVYATNIKAQNDVNTKIEFLGSDVTRFVQGGSEKIRIDSSGNLLVGTTSTTADEGGIVGRPDSDVSNIYIGHATGTAGGNPYIRFRYGSGNIGSITQSGTTAVLYNTSSDQRLKENIVDAPSASDDIDAIQVRSFDWKADGSHQKYGMVAQELQSVAPEAVTGDADSDDMMGVDYSKLVPMLVKEIQSLRARVAQLEGAE